MFHPSHDAAVLISRWRHSPPRGYQMRELLTAEMPADEVERELAALSNRSLTYVRWHLANQAIVPACLLAAALRLCARRLPLAALTRGPAVIAPPRHLPH